MERAYRHVGFALLILPAIMIAGFWMPYFGEIPHFDELITPAVHAHAIALFGWIVLIVVQPLLIVGRSFRLHRVLGKFTYVLVPCIVLLSIAMMRKEYGENVAQGATPSGALLSEYLSFIQLMLFAVCYVLAMAHARKRQIGAHLRYMLCIALILLPAGLARTLGYWFEVPQRQSQTACLSAIIGILMGLIVYDRRHGADFTPYLRVLAAYLLIGVIWVVLGRPV